MHAKAPAGKHLVSSLERSSSGGLSECCRRVYSGTWGFRTLLVTALSTRADPEACPGLPDPLTCILSAPPPAAVAEAEAAQRPLVLLGIDPDTSGALAVVRWRRAADAVGGADGLPAADIEVHDMPTMRVETGTRARKCAAAYTGRTFVLHVASGITWPASMFCCSCSQFASKALLHCRAAHPALILKGLAAAADDATDLHGRPVLHRA